MIVKFPNEKVVMVKIGLKCGTTSVYSMLVYPRLRTLEHTIYDGEEKILTPLNEYWSTKKECPFKINYKIAIVRDPVQRFYSLYKQRVLNKNLQDSKPNWEEFVNNFKNIVRPSQDLWGHSRPQYLTLGKDPSIYDYVFKTSEIDKFGKLVIKISDLDMDMPNIHYNKSLNFGKIMWITPDHTKKIKEYYTTDYKYWGDYF